MSTVAEIEAALRELPVAKPARHRKAVLPAPSRLRLAEIAAHHPADLPADASTQHDHYLYG